jgi:succinate dehydrogenase / fumarate reductase cytochrome b subunit
MSTAVPSKRLVRPNTLSSGQGLLTWLLSLLQSSVGNKLLIAVTGLGLSLFVLVHMAGNLAIFAGRHAINEYAEFLKSKPALLWSARLGLLTFFLIHLVLALRLRRRSAQARPVGYAFHQNMQANIATRTMVWSGLVILVFTLFHLAHYTLGWVAQTIPVGPNDFQRVNLLDLREHEISPGIWQGFRAEDVHLHGAHQRHDVYAMTYYGFHNPLLALLYLLAQFFLLLHLWHGFGSMFQSVGLNWPRTQNAVTWLGRAFALVVAGGNIVIVISVWSNLIPPPYPY